MVRTDSSNEELTFGSTDASIYFTISINPDDRLSEARYCVNKLQLKPEQRIEITQAKRRMDSSLPGYIHSVRPGIR
jgi:hypothetical protein